MSKVKPWLPNATPMIIGGVGFEVDLLGWTKIEGVLGKSLDQSEREQLTQIVSDYVALRAVERNPPLVADAHTQVEAVKKSAIALRDALKEVLKDGDVSERVALLFGFALREVQTEDRRAGTASPSAFIDEMEVQSDRLVRAAERVSKKLDGGPLGPAVQKTAPDYAWQWLIRALDNLADQCGLSKSVRGDVSSSGRTSPYVNFVLAVEEIFPQEYRQYTFSLGGLSKAISDARKTGAA